jgi:hypothetical protein
MSTADFQAAQFKPLVGSKIIGFSAKDDLLLVHISKDDGVELDIVVLCDEEGNGPGFLAVESCQYDAQDPTHKALLKALRKSRAIPEREERT